MSAYTPDQVAAAFIAEGQRRGIAPIGIQECLAAGLDESGLRVLANPADPASMALPNDGVGTDHDSDGPLQQRGSQGWGTLQCRMDPACSAGMFYDRLVNEDYTNLAAHTPGWYVQQVQRSDDPTGNNYDAQWDQAVSIYNRLAGAPAPVEGPGIPQTNVDEAIAFFVARIGNPYAFGGMFSPTIIRQGTDCSGECDTILRILTTGNAGPVDASGSYVRTVTTESWPYKYDADLAVAVGTVGPYGTICAGDAQPGPAPTAYPPQIPADAAAIIYLLHGGGGVDSHMMIAVNDGAGNYIVMETGGNHNDTGGTGQYASPNGPATSTTDPEWTDIWYLPGPINAGDDMAAVPQDQWDKVFNALCGQVASQSAFAKPGEGAVWTIPQLTRNDDGFIHPMYTAWAASFGQPWALATLHTIAAIDLTANPGEAENVALAQAVLAHLAAGGTVVPTPAPSPPAPAPTPPAPAPPAPAADVVTTQQLQRWGNDAVTILGIISTWATAIHDLLGQYLNGAASVAVPTACAGVAAVTGFRTIRQKNTAQKTVLKYQALRSKGTPQ